MIVNSKICHGYHFSCLVTHLFSLMDVCNFYSGDMMDRFSCVRILDGYVPCVLALNKVWNNHSHFFLLSNFCSLCNSTYGIILLYRMMFLNAI